MTPHSVQILDRDSNAVLFDIPASGNLIRLKASTVNAGFTVNDVEITKTVFGNPEGLAKYQLGTFYVVSQLVKSALPDRTDLLVPAEVVRDEKGNIIGCYSLGC